MVRWNLIVSRSISLSDENGFVRSTTAHHSIQAIEKMLHKGMTRPLSQTAPPYNKPMVPDTINIVFALSENPGLCYLIQNLDVIRENHVQVTIDAPNGLKRLWRASSDDLREKNWEVDHEAPPNTFISVVYLQIVQGLTKLYQILYALLILGPLAWLLSKEKRKKLESS
jgi:hypothetical protein